MPPNRFYCFIDFSYVYFSFMFLGTSWKGFQGFGEDLIFMVERKSVVLPEKQYTSGLMLDSPPTLQPSRTSIGAPPKIFTLV